MAMRSPFFSPCACSHEANACHVQHVGPCGAFDGEKGVPAERPACEGLDPTGRFYVGCRDRRADASGAFPADATTYAHATTVHLKRSRFGEEDACFDR